MIQPLWNKTDGLTLIVFSPMPLTGFSMPPDIERIRSAGASLMCVGHIPVGVSVLTGLTRGNPAGDRRSA